MMFFAGLWLPITQMPAVLRHISHATPLGAAVQALQDSAQGHWPHPLQLLDPGRLRGGVRAGRGEIVSLGVVPIWRVPMSHPMPLTRLDEVGRRLLPLIKYGPYVLLGGLVIFTVAGGWASGTSLAIDLALCGLAAAWMLWMFTLHPAWRVRPRVMAVFFTGFTVIMAVLVIRDPWFGFLAPAGYLYAFTVLPWPWRLPGVAAVAAVAAIAQTGGVHRVTPFGVIIYVAVLAINVVPICGLAWMDWTGDMHAEQREQTLAELSEANRRLEATLAENAGLHAQLLTQAREAGVLDERQRMAGEIHDTLAQGLAGIITQLQAAEQASADPAGWRRHVTAATRLARESLTEARRSVEALRPAALETARLSDALAGVAERWSALHGIAVQVTTTGTARPVRPDAESALLRAAQEALANVAKHAGATRVGLTLSYMDREVALDVRDDGQGFDPGRLTGRILRNEPAPATRPRAGPGSPGRRPIPGAGQERSPAGSAWPRCGSGSRACPGRCRSNRSRAAARPSRPACRSPRRGPRHDRRGRSAPIRLLIADDHPVVRDGLSGMFAADPGVRGARRGRRRRGGGPARPGPQARRDPDGPADARHGRRDRDHRAGPAGRPRPRAGADHLRHRQPRAARDRGGRDRLPAQGRAPGRAAARGPGGRPGPGGALTLGRGPADEPGPALPAPSRSASASSRSWSWWRPGTTNREAAARLFISEATVKTHLLHIYAKLGVGDRAAAVAEAFNRGLLTPAAPDRP